MILRKKEALPRLAVRIVFTHRSRQKYWSLASRIWVLYPYIGHWDTKFVCGITSASTERLPHSLPGKQGAGAA